MTSGIRTFPGTPRGGSPAAPRGFHGTPTGGPPPRTFPGTPRGPAPHAAHAGHAKKKTPWTVAKHHKAKKAKKARGLLAPGLDGGWVLGGNDTRETCAAAAVANSLLLATGIRAADAEVAAFGEGLSIEDALELAADRGLAGARLAWFAPADGIGDGVILGVALPEGPHAVVSLGGLAVSWGGLLPLDAECDEAWLPVWEAA